MPHLASMQKTLKDNPEQSVNGKKTSFFTEVWAVVVRYKILLIILGILLVDQLVKIWIKQNLYPHETVEVVEGFFQLYYIENRGMAFGTTLGEGALPKYILSIFRLVAIIVIGYYLVKNIRGKKAHKGLIFCMALIFAGATGNLIDGMFYDFIFDLDPNVAWNWALENDSNGQQQYVIDEFGNPVMRPNGFLLGSVVDMFQFTVTWPSWMGESLAGKEIFGAIWNVADFAISAGVILIIIRYRTFFKKPEEEIPAPQADAPSDQPAT
jgi:signal peptidase II